MQGGKGGEGHFLELVDWRWNHCKELPLKQCLVILHSGKAQMPAMLWDQAFEGRRSPKTILSTDNRRLSWRICLWGLLKTRHIHLFLLSKCWRLGEAHGLWTPWPHRMLGPQELLSLKSINYSMRILLKAWEVMDGMGILKMSSMRVRPAGSWTTHFLTSWLLGKAPEKFQVKDFGIFFFFFFWPQDMWDLSTRDQTCNPCMARQSLNHWEVPGSPREVPGKCQGSPIHWCF